MSGTINFGTGQTYFVFSGMTKIRLTENQVGKQINRETKESFTKKNDVVYRQTKEERRK